MKKKPKLMLFEIIDRDGDSVDEKYFKNRKVALRYAKREYGRNASVE
jgi:hypothetical protein